MTRPGRPIAGAKINIQQSKMWPVAVNWKTKQKPYTFTARFALGDRYAVEFLRRRINCKSWAQTIKQGLRSLTILDGSLYDAVKESIKAFRILEDLHKDEPDLKEAITKVREQLAIEYVFAMPPWLHDTIRRHEAFCNPTDAIARKRMKEILRMRVATYEQDAKYNKQFGLSGGDGSAQDDPEEESARVYLEDLRDAEDSEQSWCRWK